MMDFVHIWYDDRSGPKVYSTIPPAYAHGLKIKVKNLEILY